MKFMFSAEKIPLVPAMALCFNVVVNLYDKHHLNLDKFQLFVELFLICP